MEEFYIDEKSIRYCYPCETDKIVTNYGVLKEYIGKKFSREEIDRIIAEMITKHLYIENSMRLHLAIMRDRSYYHILNFRNYKYKNETKGDVEIKYEVN